MIATFASIAILIYTLVNLPFIQAYQNYRAVFCNVTITLALFVAMYYRSMKENLEMEPKAVIYGPAIILICAILATIFFSILALIYELYIFCR